MALPKARRWVPLAALWLATGYVVTLCVYHCCQGPERSFDLGHGYRLMGCPGRLAYRDAGGVRRLEDPGLDKITAFHIDGPWLIGKTDEAWFVVNKVQRQVQHPIDSLTAVTSVTGLPLSESDLVTDPYSLWFPWRREVISPSTRDSVLWGTAGYLALTSGLWFGMRCEGPKRHDSKTGLKKAPLPSSRHMAESREPIINHH